MNFELSPNDWQLLSAYMDDQLDGKEKSRLEARLNSDPALRQNLLSLEQTRVVLRSAPRRKVPRDFRLDPSTAPSRSLPVLFPVFSFASAVAALLFVILVVTDISSGLRVHQFDAAEPLPAAALVEMEKEMMAAEQPIEDAEPPPIINWAAPPSGPAMGLGGTGGGGGDGSGIPVPIDEGLAPAPQLLLEDSQEENMEQPQGEIAAEPSGEAISESDAAAAPQQKELYAQEAPPAGETLPEPQLPQEPVEELREIPETSQSDQIDSLPLEPESADDGQFSGGPILGIQPSNVPAQISTITANTLEDEPSSTTRPLMTWLLAAAALLFGFLAVIIWRKSH
jgi:hypothetical protein